MTFKDLSIRAKLMIGFSTVALLVFVVGVVGISTLQQLQDSSKSTEQFTSFLEQLAESRDILATVITIDTLDEVQQIEGAFWNAQEEIDLLLDHLKSRSPASADLFLINIDEKIDQLDDLAVEVMALHKEKITQSNIFLEQYPKEKEQRYIVREPLFSFQNPAITQAVGAMQYYSKETLYQHRDQKHLDEWLGSITKVKSLIDDPKIITELDSYYKTAQIMGDIAIRNKEIDRQEVAVLSKIQLLNNEIKAMTSTSVNRIREEAAYTSSFASIILAITMFGTVILAATVGLLISRMISKPIVEARDVAKEIAHGNLGLRIEVSSGDEIGGLAQSFNQMADNLIETNSNLEQKAENLVRSNRELEQFAYVASHDLQEPLRMVASYTQLLAKRYKEKLDADANEFIDYAVDGATRMQTLINDLLTYSRVETKGKAFEPTPTEEVLQRAVGNLQFAIQDSGATVTHDPLPKVMADGSQLIQLFQNLIANAVKFRGTEEPKVHLSAKQNGKKWMFSVRDNGIGIDPQFSERIFIIFQRLHDRAEYSGTGIGLSICKKIVERHGGCMSVKSEPGKGSTFFFTLPDLGGHPS